MIEYSERKTRAYERLFELLNPETPKERSLVAWLGEWDLETIEGITAMVERGRADQRVGRSVVNDPHDPLCQAGNAYECECDLIARVRTDQGERIARAVTTEPVPDFISSELRHGFAMALSTAARIARRSADPER